MRTTLLLFACLSIFSPLPAQIVTSTPGNIATSSGGGFVLQPGDVLRIEVWGRSEYSGLFQVNEEGFIYYPVIGELDTKEANVAAIRDTLIVELEQLFANPFVSVTPLFRVSVAGQVVAPGLYHVDPTLTVLDVVSLAGGATEVANTNKIRIFRPGETYELNFEQEVISRRTLEEIGVRSGDDIIVPRKWFARPDWTILLQAMTVAISIAILVRTY